MIRYIDEGMLSNVGMPLPSAAQLSGTPARSPRAFDLRVINTIILCRLLLLYDVYMKEMY